MAEAGPPGAPTEAEMQQMLAQMREAPAEQVLVEVVNVLLQAAQVKLGRPDARLLIDAVAAVAESIAGRADGALLDQVNQAVTQLRMAQVEAEGSTGAGAAEGAAEPTATTPPPAAPSGPPSSAQPGPAPGAGQASRLWVPGR